MRRVEKLKADRTTLIRGKITSPKTLAQRPDGRNANKSGPDTSGSAKNQADRISLKIHCYQTLVPVMAKMDECPAGFFRCLPSCQPAEKAMSFANICTQTQAIEHQSHNVTM